MSEPKIPADLSTLTQRQLEKLAETLQREYSKIRHAPGPLDVPALEAFVEAGRRVRKELKKRPEPEKAGARLVRTWPGWGRR